MSGQWFEMLLALVVVLFPLLLAWAQLVFGDRRKYGKHVSRRGISTSHGDNH